MSKILICTVDAWNSKIGASSSNSFSALFSQYPSENLANLYIREELPDSKVCGRYFQISEQNVIKSLRNGRVKTGKEVYSEASPTESQSENLAKANALYGKNRAKRSYFKLFAREFIWKLGRWRTKELDAFLEDFAPDVVVFSMEGYIHFNRICRYVLKKTKAKAVGYFWDDNFTYQQLKGNVGYLTLRYFQRRSLKKLAKYTNCFWAISPKVKREADEFFQIDCKVLTKPADMSNSDVHLLKSKDLSFPLKMIYTGNLAIGRVRSLIALSSALEKINSEHEKLIELDVYTPTELTEAEKSQLGGFVSLHPPVSIEEVAKIQAGAHILLFLEDIDGPLSKKARLSFSTKLTDYFQSGKCILALGNMDTAPMEYLMENEAAICVTNTSDIESSLRDMVENLGLLEEYAKRAVECGKRNHNEEKIQEIVRTTIESLIS